jgi:hypothetical protein
MFLKKLNKAVILINFCLKICKNQNPFLPKLRPFQPLSHDQTLFNFFYTKKGLSEKTIVYSPQ